MSDYDFSMMVAAKLYEDKKTIDRTGCWQVQYMAGHMYISSTERYQQNNLDKLQGQLEKYHPLADEA